MEYFIWFIIVGWIVHMIGIVPTWWVWNNSHDIYYLHIADHWLPFTAFAVDLHPDNDHVLGVMMICIWQTFFVHNVFARFTCLQAYKNLLNELGDQAGQHEMIAENLSTSVVHELSSLTKQLKDDRRKVKYYILWPSCCRKRHEHHHPRMLLQLAYRNSFFVTMNTCVFSIWMRVPGFNLNSNPP